MGVRAAVLRSGRPGRAGRRRRPDGLDLDLLIEIRAALEAGAAPAAALGVATSGPLATIARDLALGRSLAEVAAQVSTGDPRGDLLIRGLAVAERTGAGAADAVEQVLRAADESAALQRSLTARTAQARGTAVLLGALPVVVWVLLVLLDPTVLRFYAQPVGAVTAAIALGLMLVARAMSRRIVAAVEKAPDAVDPLLGPPGSRDPVRALAMAVPVAVILGAGAGAGVGAVAGVGAAAWGLRRRRSAVVDLSGGGTPETAELLAVALGAGLPPVAAVTEVAALGPPAARAPLADAARRLSSGWSVGEAFDGGGLERIGSVLAATARWGAPVAPALRRLAADLRADRLAAGEAAAERVQLQLLFPTTLLTLPAFVLAVVPPVLWTAFSG